MTNIVVVGGRNVPLGLALRPPRMTVLQSLFTRATSAKKHCATRPQKIRALGRIPSRYGGVAEGQDCPAPFGEQPHHLIEFQVRVHLVSKFDRQLGETSLLSRPSSRLV